MDKTQLTVRYGVSEFTDDQLAQISAIEDAVTALVDILVRKPDYLYGTDLTETTAQDIGSAAMLELADSVASGLADMGFNVYFPTHTFTKESEWVSDTFNNDPLREGA